MPRKRAPKASGQDWAVRIYEQTRNEPLIPAEEVFRKLGYKLEDFLPPQTRKKPRRAQK